MRTDYKRMRELEQIIRPDKLQACLRYYEEMSKPKGQRKSHKELGEEFGITEMTWWRWRQDPEPTGTRRTNKETRKHSQSTRRKRKINSVADV
jgi:hypothetical protein